MGLSKGLLPNMQIAILGGGLTGLIAGFRLSSDHKVTLYEKNAKIGGLLSSYNRPGYSIERYYHHFFTHDTSLLSVCDSLGMSNDIVWLKGSTGTYKNGAIFPLTTPMEIILYPHLSMIEKIRLALFTKRAKHLDVSALDRVSAESYIRTTLGEGIYRSFFRPLLQSKFGINAEKISAAWLVSRVAIRSDRGAGGERLGYIKGGFSRLLEELEESIINNGGVIKTSTPVKNLKRQGTGWLVDGEEFDVVISTIAPGQLQTLGVDTPLPDIPYQGSACLTLALSRQVTGGIYWINLYENAPYGAVIGHTCFAPFEWYNEHIVYLASYYTGDVKPDLKESMIDDFCNKFSVNPEEITWAEIAVEPYAGPLYITGYRKKIDELSIPGLYIAGMFSPENYPERSMEGSVRAGFRIADEINRLNLKREQ